MKLASFRANGEAKVGAVREPDQLVELDGIADMVSLVESGAEGLARAREALSASGARVHALNEVELLAPLSPPRGNVIAIGRNYAKHAEEGARARNEPVEPPTVFTKAITSIAGPRADIALDFSISEQMDWEVELGVVIGRRGRDIEREGALEHVFGYTVVNDISARDIQYGWGGQFFKGKSLDNTCPCGPWIVTADEIPDPQQLRLRLTVNGEVKQDATTADMIYPVAGLLAWISRGMTLLPGMLMATGTPEGVGMARQPPEFLRDGDVMESEVECIGGMRNRITSVR